MQQIQNLTRAASGVAAGFGAVNSIMALLNIESGNLSKSLVKVQAALALSQQLSQVASGIKAVNIAFKAFNATLKANPVFAIVAGLIALTGAVVGLVKWLKSGKDNTEEFNAALKDTETETFNLEYAYNREIRALKRNGAAKSDLILAEHNHTVALRNSAQAALDQINALGKLTKEQKETRDELIKTIEGYNDKIFNLEVDHHETILDEQKAADDEAAKQAEAAAKQAAAIRERYEKNIQETLKQIYAEELADRVASYNTDEIGKEVDAQRAIIDDLQSTIKDGNATLEARNSATVKLAEAQQKLNILLSAQTQIEDRQAEIDNVKQELQERINTAQEQYNLRLQEGNLLLQEYNSDQEFNNLSKAAQLELLVQEDEMLIEQSLRRIEEINNELQAEELAAERQAELLEERIALLGELDEAQVRFTANSNALTKQRLDDAEKENRDKKKLQLLQLNATAGFLSASSQLLSQNTVAAKALQVASATISTYTGASQVLADPTTPNAFLKWANFAATIATGLASVKNILAVKVPGASDSVSTQAATSIPLPSMPDLIDPIIETHNNLDAYDEDLINQERTVLVVEDLNVVQNRLNVAQEGASF